MPRNRPRHKPNLIAIYPPSPPCSCAICLAYCQRPGWWTVGQAEAAMHAGFARRMMLELSPERTFGVISPAFAGCQGGFATQPQARNGCNFLQAGLCELHDSGHLPLECSYCHHERVGQGQACHNDLERDWDTQAGQELVEHWCRQAGLWQQARPYLARRR